MGGCRTPQPPAAVVKQALVIVAALAALLVAAMAVFRPGGVSPAAQTVEQAPWQVQPLPGGGSRVFGLVLAAQGPAPAGQAPSAASAAPGPASATAAAAAAAPRGSTLADAQAAFGPGLQIGLIAAGNEPGTLEAYVDGLTAGFVTGKLVLAAGLAPEAARAMRERAVEREPLPSGALRHRLAEADLGAALQAPVQGLSFLPSLRLDATMVAQRFGDAPERLRAGGQLHLLYPALGLVVSLDGDGSQPGRAVIQYVAPARFAALREPLLRAARATAAPASSPPVR